LSAEEAIKGVERIIWLFSMVLGHSRMLWGRFVLASGSADAAALSRRGIRGTRRRAGADPL